MPHPSPISPSLSVPMTRRSLGCTDKLGFTLVEDTYQPEQDKRWALAAPPVADLHAGESHTHRPRFRLTRVRGYNPLGVTSGFAES